ncbi:MAG: glycosyltransferase family 4 protein [Candidatus Bipolaricaulaceae bacterium]
MPLVVFAGAHLGYDPQKVPIGGGATVGQALVRRWAQTRPFDLVVLGTGPLPPHPRVSYHRLAVAEEGLLTNFSVRRYARMCREFERGVTRFLARLAHEANPAHTVVVHNDIAEAGDFQAIARMGFRQVALFHVDVVDYTAQIYLRGRVSAPALARLWRGFARLKGARLAPEVVRLIFEKQELCARFCQRLVVPSSAMAAILRASYPWRTVEDVAVIPWGALVEGAPAGMEEAVAELRRRYDPAGRPVLLTLSRISPEKGQDLLLRALRLWDKRQSQDLLLFICGEAAYMHGARYLRTLRRLAARLRRTQVVFPGHVGGAMKHAFFRLADLYVFPSRHESYGLTLMEAMAAGLPVLTTRHRSAQDLVRPEFGRVVDPHPAALYRGLTELLAEPERLRLMGEEAQKHALAQPFDHAADTLAFRLLELLRGEKLIPAQSR